MFCEFCRKEIKTNSIYCKCCGNKVRDDKENEKRSIVETVPALISESMYAIKKRENPIMFEIEQLTPFDEGPSQQELAEQTRDTIVKNIFMIAIGIAVVLIFVNYIREINGW